MSPRSTLVAASIVLASLGCGGDEIGGTSGAPPEPLPPVGPIPLPDDAGVTAWPCVPGEVLADDGNCLRPGVRSCADGFELADDGGCRPILPSQDCAPGEMALPGERFCRPVAPCAAGTWGDIVVEPDTVYVDASQGPGGDGTEPSPFASLAVAVAAAPPGSLVALAAGTYESVVIDKPLRIWGLCPSQVTITDATATNLVDVLESASGTELHRVSVSGGVSHAVRITGADVLVDRVWVEGTPIGIFAARSAGAGTLPEIQVVGSLVEGAGQPLTAAGVRLLAEDSVFRDADLVAGSNGVQIRRVISDTDAKSEGTLRRCVIDGMANWGLYVWESDAVIEETAILDTRRANPEDGGAGLTLLRLFGERPSSVVLRDVVIDRAELSGLHVEGGMLVDASGLTVRQVSNEVDQAALLIVNDHESGSPDVRVERATLVGSEGLGIQQGGGSLELLGVLVRDVASGPGGGASALLFNQLEREDRPLFAAEGFAVANGRGTGVVVGGVDATMHSFRIASLKPDDVGAQGRGLEAYPWGDAAIAPSVDLSRALVEGTVGAGMIVFDSEAVLEDIEVRDVEPSAQGRAAGIIFQGVDAPARGSLSNSTISESTGYGLHLYMVQAGVLEAKGLLVEDTSVIEAGFGDGVFVVRRHGVVGEAPVLRLMDSLIRDNARGGLVSMGAGVLVEDTTFSCQPLALIGEAADGNDFTIVDEGGNHCGCDTTIEPCKALSEAVSLPEPVEASDPRTAPEL